jgi:hypothetical protein
MEKVSDEVKEKMLSKMSDEIANLMREFKFEPLDKKGIMWITKNEIRGLKWDFLVCISELEQMHFPVEFICSEIQSREEDLYKKLIERSN